VHESLEVKDYLVKAKGWVGWVGLCSPGQPEQRWGEVGGWYGERAAFIDMYTYPQQA